MTAPGAGEVPPESAGIPHCYRHPDRETYVTCQRCGRSICPDCMRPAAVGFHCPDEGGHGAARPADGGRPVGQGTRPARPGHPREARTVFGGRIPAGRPGLVTNVLIGLCVLAFLLEGVPGLSGGANNSFARDYGLDGGEIVFNHQYYRLLTAAFVHLSILHIVFNMFALYVLGVQLETILGRARFIGLFVACAVAGNTLSFLLHGVEAQSAGSSTAVFGFFTAFYVIARRLRADTGSILLILGINLIITFTLPGIDKWGHVGGLAAGLVLGAVYAYVPPRRAYAYLQALATLAVIGGCLLATVVHAHSLGVVVTR